MEGLKQGTMDEEEGVDWVDVRDTGVQFGRDTASDSVGLAGR